MKIRVLITTEVRGEMIICPLDFKIIAKSSLVQIVT